MDSFLKIVITSPEYSELPGKTCLTQRFVTGEFLRNTLAEGGWNTAVKPLTIEGTKVKVILYDKCGLSRFSTCQAIDKQIYRRADGIAILYKITDQKAFNNLPSILLALREVTSGDLPIMLVGSFNDLEEDRKISFDEGKRFADAEGMMFMETSAKTRNNVKEVFERLISESYRKAMITSSLDTPPPATSLKPQNTSSPASNKPDTPSAGIFSTLRSLLGPSNKPKTKANSLSAEIKQLLENLEQQDTDKFLNILVDRKKVTLDDFIGSGASASVWKGTLSANREKLTVAIKKFKTSELDVQEAKVFIKEALLTSEMNHPHVVKMLGISVQMPEICLILEYCCYGGLDRIIRGKTELYLGDQLRICSECASGLEYIHGRGMIHRDIKSLNFLVNESWHIKLTDFGESKVFVAGRDQTAEKGSVPWNAPELLAGKTDYDLKVDIYSLAIVFWEIFERIQPYPGMFSYQIITAVMQGTRVPLPRDAPTDLIDLLQRMWNERPENRPQAKDVVMSLTKIKQQLLQGELKCALPT